ncbi:hypothetical protein [Nostoc sp.]|uniref:hypothetical protein n=1 Tax=Nostoc sp. TaxID=1180 RepID=UPI002FF8A067
MSTDPGDLRSHQSDVFEWAGGVGTEVFGDAGETKPSLFDGAGGKIVGSVRDGM